MQRKLQYSSELPTVVETAALEIDLTTYCVPFYHVRWDVYIKKCVWLGTDDQDEIVVSIM